MCFFLSRLFRLGNHLLLFCHLVRSFVRALARSFIHYHSHSHTRTHTRYVFLFSAQLHVKLSQINVVTIHTLLECDIYYHGMEYSVDCTHLDTTTQHRRKQLNERRKKIKKSPINPPPSEHKKKHKHSLSLSRSLAFAHLIHTHSYVARCIYTTFVYHSSIACFSAQRTSSSLSPRTAFDSFFVHFVFVFNSFVSVLIIFYVVFFSSFKTKY